MNKKEQSREVPPERRTMGVQGIYRLLDSLGCICGQYTGMVFPYQIK